MKGMRGYDDKGLLAALSELQVIKPEDLEAAAKESQEKKAGLAEVLLKKGLISDENLGRIVADLTGFPLVRLGQLAIADEVLRIIPEVVARKQKILAFALDSSGLSLAMADPKNSEVRDFVAKKTGIPVKVFYATERDLDLAVGLYKKDLQKSFDQLLADEVGKARGDEAPIIKIVNLLIEYAYANRASDIHIEPEKKKSIVRFRIDGVLHDVLELTPAVYGQIVAKIKVASRLRTDEHLSAQDGKMQAAAGSTENLVYRA